MQFIRDIMAEEISNIKGFDVAELIDTTSTPALKEWLDFLIRDTKSHEYESAVEWLIGEHDVVFYFTEEDDTITDVAIVRIAGNDVTHSECIEAMGDDFVGRLVRYARDNYEDVSKWGETQ